MAYKVQKRQRVVEELELINEDGTLAKTIVIDLDVDAVAKNISEKQIALIKAQQSIKASNKENTNETLELIGKTTVDLFEAVFGKESTEDILNFYESKPIEMCQDILPFITDVIIPQVRKTAQDNKQNLINSYKKKRFGIL